MEYNSFYGGRRGTSFVLVKSFPDIPSMVAQFERGGDYIDVNYDEYVIINTVNKNHPDNGKIFRRGYDYNSSRTIIGYRAYRSNNTQIINGTAEEYAVARYQKDDIPAAGAIYEGTIVGPAGRAPMLTLTTYADAEAKQAATGFDERKSFGSYAPLENLYPGKQVKNGQTIFHDAIEWYCTSIRNVNDEDTEAYIGFKMPYTVIDYMTHRVEPYNSSGNYADMTSAIRVDDGTHPFFEKWNIAVPDGVKGQSVRNFRVIVPKAGDVIYTVGTTTQYPGFQDDVNGARQILVYDYYKYDQKKNPAKITYFVGDYNQISDITLQEDGTLIIAYTHDSTDTYSKWIKWIKSITFNRDVNNAQDQPGHVVIKYNTGATDEFDLDWVQNITFDPDGTVNIDRTVSGINSIQHLIKWISTVSLDSTQGGTNEGLLTVSFNNGPNYTTRLKWVNDITLANNGQITLHYSGNGTDKVLTNAIKWVDNVSINTGATEGTGNQKVHVTYNNGSSADIGQPLNYIMKTKMTDDKHMILLYSDPARRAALKSGQLTPVYQTIEGSYEVDGVQGWLDLGSFHVDSGILIGLDVAAEDMPAGTDINEPGDVINYLNSAYPEGLTGENLEDKIVTAGTTGNKMFYGYNYDTHEWYSLGTISGYEIATIDDIDKMMEDELPSDAVVGTAIVGKDIIVVEDGQ